MTAPEVGAHRTQLDAAVKFLHGAKAETLRSPDAPATVTTVQ